ncbi:unnamed protein product [Paramecium sonneborni]|uniref:Uncharacterized protein n=1 Tax=Paramecium sonneborni TaxID=65129 RepID=A0A8S1RPR0_9CILI|nr:unnamed protein product [Paramecium sonneborni]
MISNLSPPNGILEETTRGVSQWQLNLISNTLRYKSLFAGVMKYRKKIFRQLMRLFSNTLDIQLCLLLEEYKITTLISFLTTPKKQRREDYKLKINQV